MRALFVILALSLSAGPLAGCGPSLIRGPQIAKDADIEDTPEHRVLLTIVTKYGKAMEERNVQALLDMASRNYYERAGTTQTDDDYGYDKLGEILKARLAKLETLRLRLTVDRLAIDGQRAVIDYSYTGRYLIKGAKRQHWAQKSWESRFRLEKLDGQWLVLSGM